MFARKETVGIKIRKDIVCYFVYNNRACFIDSNPKIFNSRVGTILDGF